MRLHYVNKTLKKYIFSINFFFFFPKWHTCLVAELYFAKSYHWECEVDDQISIEGNPPECRLTACLRRPFCLLLNIERCNAKWEKCTQINLRRQFDCPLFVNGAQQGIWGVRIERRPCFVFDCKSMFMVTMFNLSSVNLRPPFCWKCYSSC